MAYNLYDEIIFREHPILDEGESLSEDDKDFGITPLDYQLECSDPIDKNFIKVSTDEFSQQDYRLALLNKLDSLSTSQIDEFLDYQTQKIFDKKKWLIKLERLVEIGNSDIGVNIYRDKLDKVFEPLRNRIKKYQGKNKNSTRSGSIVPPSFTYKQLPKGSQKINYLWNGLKKNKFINPSTTATHFIKVFSGNELTKPIIWTRKPSDFYYFIYLIYTKYHLVEDVRQKQWEIACKCFVQEDGIPFERKKLKGLDRPALTGAILDEIVECLF